jgi:membrane associated rhomboid family serine protease
MFQRLTPVVKNLLIINVGIYFLVSVFHLDLSKWFGLHYIFSDNFMPHQFITYMFLHASWMHVFSNMFALFMFGPLLEQFWGPKKFLIFYMVTGLGSGLMYSGTHYFEIHKFQVATENYVQHPGADNYSDLIASNHNVFNYFPSTNDIESDLYDHPGDAAVVDESVNFVTQVYKLISNIPMVGASGAVFGILMAFGMLFPNTVLMLLFPPIPIKAKYFVAIYGLFELYAGMHQAPGDNIAHFAHIGGMLIAFILIKYWQKKDMRFY